MKAFILQVLAKQSQSQHQKADRYNTSLNVLFILFVSSVSAAMWNLGLYSLLSNLAE